MITEVALADDRSHPCRRWLEGTAQCSVSTQAVLGHFLSFRFILFHSSRVNWFNFGYFRLISSHFIYNLFHLVLSHLISSIRVWDSLSVLSQYSVNTQSVISQYSVSTQSVLSQYAVSTQVSTQVSTRSFHSISVRVVSFRFISFHLIQSPLISVQFSSFHGFISCGSINFGSVYVLCRY